MHLASTNSCNSAVFLLTDECHKALRMLRLIKDLNSDHRSYLIYQQGIKPAIINFILNGVIAWIVMKKHDSLTLLGETGVVKDLLLTGFILPFLTCVIVSPLLTKQIRKGELQSLSSLKVQSSQWMHRSILIRATFIGVAGLVLAAIPAILLLQHGFQQPFTVSFYAFFKGIWAGVFAAIVTPIIAFWAIGSISESNNDS